MKIWIVFLSIFFQESLFSAQYTINFSTWYDFVNLNASDPGGATKLLKGLNAAGASPSSLHADDGPNTTYDGDLIELGYYKLASGAASTTAFKGVWTPITSKTTIGQDASFLTSPPSTTTNYTVPAGEFQFNSNFYLSQAGKVDGQGYINNTGASSYRITDLATNGAANLAILDDSTSNLLGIRFYDINTGGDGSTTKATNGTTRYNTIMDAAWTMPGNGGTVNMALHDNSGGSMSVNSSVVFEFDNTAAYTANLAKVGTGNTRVENDDYVATVTYHDGSSNLALNTIGSSVISGLSGSGTLTDNGSGKTLTLHSRTGNTVADAYSFGGTITGDTTVIKTGEGEQKLTSTLSVSDTTGFVYIDDGIFNLAPGTTGVTQSMEYLTSAASLGSTDPIFALDNDNGADQTVTFGLTDSSHTSTDREFKGKVYLSDSGTNTLKVSSNTASGDYAKTQILSGVISGSSGGTAQAGSAKLKKTGKGRLELSGANTFNGGVDIDDGTVVAGHADALGASGNTVTINKGKLEVSSGITLSQGTINGAASGTGKSMIGGAGTVSTLTIGSGNNEVSYISPGRGISSSLTPSLKAVDLDTGTDAIGNFTVNTLNWNNGGVFDWQIKDFNPAGGTAGTHWDKLSFGTLNFQSSQNFDINIIALKGASFDGTMGNVSNNGNTWNNYSTTNGFLFAAGTTINGLSDGDVSSSFTVRSDDYSPSVGHWYGDWGVYKDGGNLYLTYSVAPEPSTYIMVTGLFMLPGFRMFRKWRKKSTSSVTDTEEA
ncbi:hypothetical protein N9E34_00110 [Opitutales bacterium]|nr:hypothetical protein [Opitutales bacterium]